MRMIDLAENPDGHAAPITHVTFRPDGDRLATCSYDGTVRIWDSSDPAQLTEIGVFRHRRLVNGAAWHPTDPDLIATASADKTVGVWRLGTGLVNVLARHTDDVNAVAWLPDGQRLACVSEDGRATLWQAFSGAYLGEVGTHTAHCMMVSVSRAGLIATVGEDGLVTVTGPDEPGEPATRHYDTSVEGCAWSHAGTVLAVARDDGTVDLLNPDLTLIRRIDAAGSAARTVAWSDDDSRLIVGAYDGSLSIFDSVGRRVRAIRDARVWPRSVHTAHGRIAAGSFGSRPHVFDLHTGSPLSGSGRRTHGPNAMAVVGSDLLVGCDSGTVLAINLDDPTRVRATRICDSPILSLAGHDGVAFAGTYAGEVLSWFGVVLNRTSVGAPVPSLAMTDAGLIAGTYNGDLLALDPVALAIRGRGAPHGGSVKSLVAVSGGFLSASTDRTVAIGTLRDRATLWEHGNLVNAVACLDGAVVASAGRDHTVKVGTMDGTHRQTLLGPDESVKCVGLIGDPSAPVVLAGSYDFRLYAWTVDWAGRAAGLRSGRVLAEFRQGLSCMTAIDRTRVAVAGWDGRILIIEHTTKGPAVQHDLSVTDLMARARQAVPA